MRDFSNISLISPRVEHHVELDTTVDRAIVSVANVDVDEEQAIAHLLAHGLSIEVAVNVVRAAEILRRG